jgi:hypothetical protein
MAQASRSLRATAVAAALPLALGYPELGLVDERVPHHREHAAHRALVDPRAAATPGATSARRSMVGAMSERAERGSDRPESGRRVRGLHSRKCRKVRAIPLRRAGSSPVRSAENPVYARGFLRPSVRCQKRCQNRRARKCHRRGPRSPSRSPPQRGPTTVPQTPSASHRPHLQRGAGRPRRRGARCARRAGTSPRTPRAIGSRGRC